MIPPAVMQTQLSVLPGAGGHFVPVGVAEVRETRSRQRSETTVISIGTVRLILFLAQLSTTCVLYTGSMSYVQIIGGQCACDYYCIIVL